MYLNIFGLFCLLLIYFGHNVYIRNETNGGSWIATDLADIISYMGYIGSALVILYA